MAFLKDQHKLSEQCKGYSDFLVKRERFKIGTASFFAKQLQDFTESQLTPKSYFDRITEIDRRAAETFLNNFKHYVQYQTNQYFDDFHKLQWELGRKHKKGGF